MEWNRTYFLEERLTGVRTDGIYRGRPIIHRDSPIDGGVCLGAVQREAIVVDSVLSPSLQNLVEDVLHRITDWKGKYHSDNLPAAVYKTVWKRMQCDPEKVSDIVKQYTSSPDEGILLDVFLKEGYGVCRHQALLAGFLMETFRKQGIIDGQVSIDRNTFDSNAHAWCRYTPDAGEIIIIDPSRKFLGTLEESLRTKWVYFRESDL